MELDLKQELGPLGRMMAQAENLRLVIKDPEHRYRYVNSGWLESVGFEQDAEVLGKTVFDVFPLWRARKYHEEETRVIHQEKTIDTCEEISMGPGGRKQLWRSLKAPRYDTEGSVVGMIIVGMLIEPEMLRSRLKDVRPSAVEWVEQHACDSFKVEDLAKEMQCSRRSLERNFQENTGMSPIQYRLQCRLARVRELLKFSSKPVAIIAAECGFSDQSHLTKVFRAEFGLTPGHWRRQS